MEYDEAGVKDVTLTYAMLALTPSERLKQADAFANLC